MKKLFLLVAFLLISFIVKSQVIPGEGLIVVEFNAPFSGTKCEYLDELTDCDLAKIDITTQPKLQAKHKIVVVPTIIVFYDGEEVARFQANIMMKLEATQEEVQDKIDETIMSDF
jgi:thioredoxin-like negative regulator of GroEL|tara:strand:- start:733 stop:1077 length:345 start_codon:yes stop_codon:yes gene_type:complete